MLHRIRSSYLVRGAVLSGSLLLGACGGVDSEADDESAVLAFRYASAPTLFATDAGVAIAVPPPNPVDRGVLMSPDAGTVTSSNARMSVDGWNLDHTSWVANNCALPPYDHSNPDMIQLMVTTINGDPAMLAIAAGYPGAVVKNVSVAAGKITFSLAIDAARSCFADVVFLMGGMNMVPPPLVSTPGINAKNCLGFTEARVEGNEKVEPPVYNLCITDSATPPNKVCHPAKYLPGNPRCFTSELPAATPQVLGFPAIPAGRYYCIHNGGLNPVPAWFGAGPLPKEVTDDGMRKYAGACHNAAGAPVPEKK